MTQIHDYPLDPDSIVFDVGGHKGTWTNDLIDALGFSPEIQARRYQKAFSLLRLVRNDMLAQDIGMRQNHGRIDSPRWGRLRDLSATFL